MAGCFTFLLVAIATAISVAESRAVPAEPISLVMDSYGNPVVVLREKRTAPYPQRAMMFTGYYRPVRRSNGHASGVFAQGNAVSGEAFFGGMQAPHLHRGPEPIEEPEISSSEAQASPEDPSIAEEEETVQEHPQEEEHHHHHRHPEEHHHHEENDQHDQHHHHEPHTPQDHHEPEPAFTTEPSAVTSAEDPAVGSTEVSVNHPKTRPGKKTKKTPVVVDEEDDDDEEDEEEPVVPFVPFKGTKRRQNYPHLNNFFPMVFSFPGVATRAGSSGSPPGAVTAIANSYSTGKGGVASSVATAYGGSPNGKKRRTTPSEE